MVEQERRQRRERRPSLIGEDALRHEIEKCEGRREQPIFQNEEARQRRPGERAAPTTASIRKAAAASAHSRARASGRRTLELTSSCGRLCEIESRMPRVDQAVKQTDRDDARQAEGPGGVLGLARHPARSWRLNRHRFSRQTRANARARSCQFDVAGLRSIGAAKTYGSSTVDPVVSRASRSRCARAASASG